MWMNWNAPFRAYRLRTGWYLAAQPLNHASGLLRNMLMQPTHLYATQDCPILTCCFWGWCHNIYNLASMRWNTHSSENLWKVEFRGKAEFNRPRARWQAKCLAFILISTHTWCSLIRWYGLWEYAFFLAEIVKMRTWQREWRRNCYRQG